MSERIDRDEALALLEPERVVDSVALVPFIYLPAIVAADFFRERLVGSVKATAALKLVSAIMLAAVVAVLAANISL